MQQNWILTFQNIPSTPSDTVLARKNVFFATEDARLIVCLPLLSILFLACFVDSLLKCLTEAWRLHLSISVDEARFGDTGRDAAIATKSANPLDVNVKRFFLQNSKAERLLRQSFSFAKDAQACSQCVEEFCPAVYSNADSTSRLLGRLSSLLQSLTSDHTKAVVEGETGCSTSVGTLS